METTAGFTALLLSMNFPPLDPGFSPGFPPLSSGEFDRSVRLRPPSIFVEENGGDFEEKEGSKESPSSIIDQDESQYHSVDRGRSSNSPTRDDSTSSPSASPQRKRRCGGMSISEGQSSCRETNPYIASPEQYNDHASSEQQDTNSGGSPNDAFYTHENATPMESDEAPWPKRFRWGKIPDARERNTGRKSALELAMRRSKDRKSYAIVTPEIGMQFDSLQEAYEFYNLYSWEIGFGIRYGSSRKNPAKSIIRQDITCSCEGKPRHVNTRSKCCGCQALIRLHRTADNGWYIHEFRKDHNHGFATNNIQKMHWASHRSIDPPTKQLITNLRDNNVGLTTVFSIVGSFFGSMENIPFNKRSLKCLCASISKDHCQDDIRKTVDVFSELKLKDPNFRDSCLVDSRRKIRALMWTNGKSRMQYKQFGDAVTFDTTYRTNCYDMPFGIFVGVNNHFQSILFAGVLLTDEKTETFEWVFKEFVNLMGGKPPVTILTDQCRAMELAISEVWPGTTHRWCKWHVVRKAKEHMGVLWSKASGFRDEFHKTMEYMYTIDEFEAAWQALITKYGLEDHPFLTQIYDVREMWAKPFFAGKFCARMTSTQRSESANHMLKGFVPPGSAMNMFVKHYQKLQFDRDGEENFQEMKSRLGGLVLNTGLPIEMHASKIYTPNMFYQFQVQLYLSGSFSVKSLSDSDVYTVQHVFAEKRQKWSRTEFEVHLDKEADFFHCECGLYEHMGMVCGHTIRVMITAGITEIPESHIMRRWTKDAYRDLPDHLTMYQNDSPVMKSTSFRHSALYRTAIEIVQLGDTNPESYEIAMAHMLDAMPALSQASKTIDGLGLEERVHAAGCSTSAEGEQNFSGSLRPNMVAPPKRSEIGRPTNARAKPRYEVSVPRTKFCSICRGKGHRADGCPSNKNSTKKPRREAHCSNCGLAGHKKNNCLRVNP